MSSFYHSGDIGDLLYGLSVIRTLGGGSLFVGTDTGLGKQQPRTGITLPVLSYIASFINQQGYIRELRWQARVPFVTYNLNTFRHYWTGELTVPRKNAIPHLLEMHYAAVQQPCNWSPWLTAFNTRLAKVIIGRSPRQQNAKFPWLRVCDKYASDCLFLGLPEEYEAFVKQHRRVPYRQTHTLAEVAAIVNGADLVICNSTAMLALALGLGKPVIQELPNTVDRAHTQSCVDICTDDIDGTVLLPNL